jgi:hypothetical protein
LADVLNADDILFKKLFVLLCYWLILDLDEGLFVRHDKVAFIVVLHRVELLLVGFLEEVASKSVF